MTFLDLSIDQYSYDCSFSISRFFTLLGTVFGFVLKDVKDKIGILEHYLQNKENKQFYSTIQSMIQYETSENKTIVKAYPPSGARTLLRLHRALAFIIAFLQNLIKLEKDTKLANIAWECYNNTLSKHHTWIIRKGVGIAVYTLPTRDQLLAQMGQENNKEIKELVQDIINKLQHIYDTVETLYTKYDLHNLP